MTFIDDKEIAAAMSVKLDYDVLPEKATFQEGIRRAPVTFLENSIKS